MLNLPELVSLCQLHGIPCAQNERLAPHTTFRVGGACPALVTPGSIQSLQLILRYLSENSIPHYLIGRGSNLLVPDEGYPGVVVKLGGAFAGNPQTDAEAGTVMGYAGMNLKKLCVAAANASLTGLEFAYGIPGTVGGAVYMNAGAYSGEMAQVVTSVQALDPDYQVQSLSAADLAFRYRHSCFMDTHRGWIILSATVQLQKGDPGEIRAKMQELLGKRQAKQPLEYASAGSTFKRPADKVYASRLIDECGLKGYRVGDAQVSTKHAGFVINRGNATYAEIIAVCQHVREVVKQDTGFVLELEPEILAVPQ